MYQRNSLGRFNTVIRNSVRDIAAQDALLERFGGNKSLKEIYVDGCCENAGRDIEEVVATRKYEQKLFKEAGLLIEESRLENDNSEVSDSGLSEESVNGQK